MRTDKKQSVRLSSAIAVFLSAVARVSEDELVFYGDCRTVGDRIAVGALDATAAVMH